MAEASASGWRSSLGVIASWTAIACVAAGGCTTGARLAPGGAPVAVVPEPRQSGITPLDTSVGRVLRVHQPLRFAVVDFSLSRVPEPGTRLEARRDGSRTGILKAGHFRRETTLVADIVSGDVAEGDEVRPEIAD